MQMNTIFGVHPSLKQASLAILLAIVAEAALAAPAPWFIWQSKTAEHAICHQTFPGKGWSKIAGPYSNSQCGKQLKLLKMGKAQWTVEPRHQAPNHQVPSHK